MKLFFMRHDMNALLGIVSEYRLLFSINIVVVLIGAALEGVGIGLLVPVLESLNVGSESDSFFTTQAKHLFAYTGIKYTFINLIIVFTALMLSKYLMLMVQQRLSRMLSSSATRDLRIESVSNLLSVSLGYFHNKKLGDIVSTIFNSTQNTGGALEYFVMMIKGAVFALAYLVVAFMLSWELSVGLLGFVLIAYFLIWPRFMKGKQYGAMEKELMDSIYSELQDKIGGMKVVKQFSTEKKMLNEVKVLVRNYQENAVNLMDNKIISYAFFEPFLFLLMVTLIVVSTEMFAIPLASMLVMLIIFTQMIPQFKTINSNLLVLNELLPHHHKVQDLISKIGKPYITDGSQSISKIETNIELKQVSFSYDGCENLVLDNINIIFPARKTTAIVGPSGGGKSTLIELLARNYDPDKGKVLVDGVNIKDVKKINWKQLMAVVDQDCYLFHESIYDNIRYGKINATQDEVIQAASKANAHEFIENTEDGYETLIGQRGTRLSGGQRQRVALARALIREPELLILDEATSALDGESERLVQVAVDNLKSSITLVIIAHRLSTIKHADLIVFIDNGRVLESGSHDELMHQGGRYSQHVRLQYDEV